MSKRTLIICIIAIIIIGGVIVFSFLFKKKSTVILTNKIDAQTDNIVQPTTQSEKVIPPLKVAPAVDSEIKSNNEAPEEIMIKTTATAFAEFYGTYASGSYSQFNGVKSISTELFQSTLKNTELELAKRPTEKITTDALVTKILSKDAGNAIVEVTTQRTRIITGKTSEIFRQKIRLTLLRQNDRWLVDTAQWNEQTF